MKQNRLVERFLGLVLGVLFLTLVSAGYAFSQEATGNIIGTITDEHGAGNVESDRPDDVD